MTEKQFYIDTIDGGESVLTDNGKELSLNETCNLLNELYEKDKDGEECYRKLLEKYDKLKKENRQYKKKSISFKQLYKILEENKEYFLSLSECFSEKLLIKTIFRNIDEDIESMEEEE